MHKPQSEDVNKVCIEQIDLGQTLIINAAAEPLPQVYYEYHFSKSIERVFKSLVREGE